MQATRGMIGGAASGLLLGVGICVALGVVGAPAQARPNYTVHYNGPVLLITDNESNRLYVYENTGEKSVLRHFVDLSKTGQPELVATMPDEARK